MLSGRQMLICFTISTVLLCGTLFLMTNGGELLESRTWGQAYTTEMSVGLEGSKDGTLLVLIPIDNNSAEKHPPLKTLLSNFPTMKSANKAIVTYRWEYKVMSRLGRHSVTKTFPVVADCKPISDN